MSLVGEPYTGKNKWYGALPKRRVYCVPNCSRHVLRFDTESETTSLLGDLPGDGRHGGAIGGDGNVYCVPAHATSAQNMRRDGEVKQIGKGLPATKYKWAEHAPIAR